MSTAKLNVDSRLLQPVILIVAVLAATLFLSGSLVRLSSGQQMYQAWGVFLLFLLLRRLLHHRFPMFFCLILSLCTLFFLARYLLFRVTSTLIFVSPLEFVLVMLLFAAELHGMLIHTFGLVVNIFPLFRPVEPVDLSDPNLPTVDVLIPTYNEPEQMVAVTASACKLINYPKEKINIFILDDGGTVEKRNDPDKEKADTALGRHETFKVLAEYLEVHYLTREKNQSAKAGNLNDALYKTVEGQVHPQGDLVLVLDCDHVPTRDFLSNTVGYFLRDPKLFLVQTPHFFINPDPIEKNLRTYNKNPGDFMMFYGKVLPGLDFWNSAFFCGSAAILRRRCLDEVGGVVGETITEDAETALTLHSRGYNSVYVAKPMICGLSPETFEDFIIQRNRWAQGMTQILLLKNPLFMRGLSLIQRICYLNSAGFWFFSFSRLVFLLAPLSFIFLNLQVYHATLFQCLAYPIPYIAMTMVLTNVMYGSVRHPFFSELYETVLTFYNIPAVLSVLRNPHSPQFHVTPKDTSLARDTASPLAPPFYLLIGLMLLMYPMALFRLHASPQLLGPIVICLAWGTFNLIILLMSLGVVWERRQIRTKHRVAVREPIRLRVKNGKEEDWLDGWAMDLAEEGMGITLNSVETIKMDTVIEIEAKSSGGGRFLFTAEVVRAVTEKGRLNLGCQYLYEDEDSYFAITNHLYGESERWQRLWQGRQQQIHILPAFWYVLKLGASGTYNHCKGLCKTFWQSIRHKQQYRENI
ncbi:MAG: UDP-forming cellulose synthase catalytic subunit [Thermodesulfobacteriota bacterium]